MAEVQLVILFTSVALVVIGLYSAIFLDNIIKKIIGISFIEEGVNLFIVAIGYKAGGIVPILMPGMDTTWFASNAAYPLPFGLVLTSIVIGASTLAVMLASLFSLCWNMAPSPSGLSMKSVLIHSVFNITPSLGPSL